MNACTTTKINPTTPSPLPTTPQPGPVISQTAPRAREIHRQDWCWENFINSRSMGSAENVRSQLERMLKRMEVRCCMGLVFGVCVWEKGDGGVVWGMWRHDRNTPSKHTKHTRYNYK